MEQVNLWPWRQTRRRRRLRCLLLLALAQWLLMLALIGAPAVYWRQQRLALETSLADMPLPREASLAGAAAPGVAPTVSTARERFQLWLDSGNQRYLRLFRQLPALLPPQLWLTHIEQRNGRLYISGCSEGYSPVVVLRRRLAGHALLPDVRWREVRQRDAVRWQFFLEADWPVEDAA